nr:RecName: Full=Helofensin-1; AltName: Full=Lethal toxin [Heloderma horridum horridum]
AYTTEQCRALNGTCRFYACFPKNVVIGKCDWLG